VKVRILSLFFCMAVSPMLAQSQSQTCSPPVGQEGSPFSCSITFSPGTAGTSTGVFDFSTQQDGIITFQFDTVLTTFTLTVSANEVTSVQIDPDSEVAGATCITYFRSNNTSNHDCVRYDVAGSGGAGLDGLPLRGTDYRGLINTTLKYESFEQIQMPVFGHAPGDTNQIFSENIITSYVDENAPPSTPNPDPAMGGKTPGLSSLAALTQPFANGASGLFVCQYLTATPQKSTSGNNPIVEVTFRLATTQANCITGPYLRDKTASLTVATSPGLAFVNLVNDGDSNKFHFDNKSGANIQDINTNKLPSGTYFVTVISEQFSPVTTTFTIP
jgi:hypothetical protein